MASATKKNTNKKKKTTKTKLSGGISTTRNTSVPSYAQGYNFSIGATAANKKAAKNNAKKVTEAFGSAKSKTTATKTSAKTVRRSHPIEIDVIQPGNVTEPVASAGTSNKANMTSLKKSEIWDKDSIDASHYVPLKSNAYYSRERNFKGVISNAKNQWWQKKSPQFSNGRYSDVFTTPVEMDTNKYKVDTPKVPKYYGSSVKYSSFTKDSTDLRLDGKEASTVDLLNQNKGKFEVGESFLLAGKEGGGYLGDGKDGTLKNFVDRIKTVIMMPATSNTLFHDYRNMTMYYNRFKLANPNLPLQRGFPHVFFVKPSCDILTAQSGDSFGELKSEFANNELFTYAYNHEPRILAELTQDNYNNPTQFMMSLSNFVKSFSPSDEYINTDTYGKTWTGYKVAYGKSGIESKTAGNISITFEDDRMLHVYQTIRLWVEYINGVYRGKFSPLSSNIMYKILDYVGALYYIVTAEDGETIIFWSKYYGIFPSEIPASQYSWGEGNIITNPELTITFQYSWKEDYNPYDLIAFNTNAKIKKGSNPKYLPIYNKEIGHSTNKWGETPFIELVQTDMTKTGSIQPYTYKLRFTPKS